MSLALFLRPLLGGALIGISVSMLLLFNGRIAGISGILGVTIDSVRSSSASFVTLINEHAWRLMFLIGLLSGGGLMLIAGNFLNISFFENTTDVGKTATVIAGLLVGFGTRLGSGCTSGHGICGMSRLSRRSIVATVIFIAAGMLTVAVLR